MRRDSFRKYRFGLACSAPGTWLDDAALAVPAGRLTAEREAAEFEAAAGRPADRLTKPAVIFEPSEVNSKSIRLHTAQIEPYTTTCRTH